MIDRLIWLVLRALRIRPDEVRVEAPEELGPHVEPAERNRRWLPASPRAEAVVAALLVAAGGFGIAFVVLYAATSNNQLLGLMFGLALMCLAVALIVAGKRVVAQEELVEQRPELIDDAAEGEAVQLLESGVEGVSRRRLIMTAAGVTGLGVGAALVAPIASCGPNVSNRINDTAWQKGRGVVDDHGKPILADDVVPKTFLTGFPDGADPAQLGSPIVIVRVAPAKLHLPDGRPPEEWAPEGIVAYSKVCTHAGCAIALYRDPLFNGPRPALVCPCHYSTFDPARGAEVIFGPAGRSLPQLPLAIDPTTRQLVANGRYSGSIGPAWFNVNRGTKQ